MVTDLLCKKSDYLADTGRHYGQRADLIGVLMLRLMKNELYTTAKLGENIMRQKRIYTVPSPKQSGGQEGHYISRFTYFGATLFL
jgi:hypothetical protein